MSEIVPAEPEETGPSGEPQIEAPPSLLPDLTEWGIEEIERGVCEDTFGNRRAIKQNKASWIPVFDTNGYPTPYIQVVSSEMHQRAKATERISILSDPQDMDSDYITGFSLLLESRAPEIVPTWVLRITRNFQKLEDEREALGPDAAALDSRLVYPPGRCNARKADGTRCWGWHNGTTDMDFLCRIHAKSHSGNKRPLYGPSQKQIAHNRLASGLVGAVEVIEELMVSSTDERVRLAAAKEWLEKGGMKEAIQIEQKVEHKGEDAAAILLNRLADLKKGHDDKIDLLKELEARHGAGEIEDAEVIEDE
ncbi:hypothetical protein QEH42_gp166 [Microbacterium phage Pumpernickel]|uniref:Uncharacterized protein n=1 Tax=Microbacterium phage Pumpernickel TaxID=2885983 RepID=A0AAE9C303_9CAUD|nr:hypothetical protein QEH42_gp001 [Microbacterium phage Pumpernickel]YP_010755292.1 hypothetical protein QEH42_gp166 [Microbacterium phage Pumpernickel]UDL15792.1 hypothetical protein SEA_PUMPERNICKEL_1 [Microbacterium phage Pumpernickel]UDL16052.1 hypothetical protein SEA_PUMPERNICKEL_302 [Microbacterium phage Pumpernickel]